MCKWQLVAVGVLERTVPFLSAHLRTKIYTARTAAAVHIEIKKKTYRRDCLREI